MMNYSKMMFYTILISSTLMTMSSQTWLGMWMGLEINLIAFIPTMYKTKNSSTSESCMIYFLIQSIGSIIMLISILSNSLITVSYELISEMFHLMLISSMMIKLGMAPFHYWFPEMMEKMNWINCLILMTWQKLAPLSILSLILNKTSMFPIMAAITAMIGAIGGLNQTSIRKIMAFSSINHMSWMTGCMMFSNNTWIKYLIIYSIITMMMIMIFYSKSSSFINQLMNQTPTMTEKLLITSLFLSLGGLPPFLGFLPKWMIIQSMIESDSYTLLAIMIMSTLITLFYYMRLSSVLMLINNMSLKWNNNNNLNTSTVALMFLMNMSLPMMSMVNL